MIAPPKNLVFMIELLISEKSFKIIELFKFLLVVFGSVVGLTTISGYLKQNQQRKIDNSYRIVEDFFKKITEKHLSIWKNIYINSTESCGARDGSFVLIDENGNKQLISISNLFLREGSGSIYDHGSVREIAEFLNFVSYHVLKGKVDFNIIYYELGQFLETVHWWILQIDDQALKDHIEKDWLPYLLMLYRRKSVRMRKLPRKTYVSSC